MCVVDLIILAGEGQQPLQAMEPQLKFGRVRASDFEHLFVAKDEGKNGKWGVFGIITTIPLSFNYNDVIDEFKGERGAAQIVVLPTKMAQGFVEKNPAKKLMTLAFQKQRGATHHGLHSTLFYREQTRPVPSYLDRFLETEEINERMARYIGHDCTVQSWTTLDVSHKVLENCSFAHSQPALTNCSVCGSSK
jgi:hypothetical protein